MRRAFGECRVHKLQCNRMKIYISVEEINSIALDVSIFIKIQYALSLTGGGKQKDG